METFFVLLGLLVLAFPIIAIVALVKAIGLGNQLRRVDMQLAALERRVAQSSPGAAARPPEPTAHVPEPAPIAPAPPAAEAPAEPSVMQEHEPAIAAASPIVPPPSAPPTTPDAPAMSLEERLGTQWAVWVGGIALALGGIFLVRYSIEQGLLGPAVRVTLGALLAVALIVAGEWARRTELLSGISGCRPRIFQAS